MIYIRTVWLLVLLSCVAYDVYAITQSGTTTDIVLWAYMAFLATLLSVYHAICMVEEDDEKRL